MTVRSRLQSVRSSTAFDDDLERIRRRMEVTSKKALEVLDGLKRFLAEEPQPGTQKQFERIGIRLQVASEAMMAAAGKTKRE